MIDNQMTELQEILDRFEYECFMLRTEASDTRAKDDVVRVSYKRIRDEFAGRIVETLGRIRYERDELEGFAKRVEDAVNNCEDLTLFGRDYMLLPVDADGVPIHVGDWMIVDEGEPFNVCAVAPARIHAWCKKMIGDNGPSTVQYVPGRIKHYKPRTLEDVLEELVECASLPGKKLDRGDVEGFAVEIRKLLGSDAE